MTNIMHGLWNISDYLEPTVFKERRFLEQILSYIFMDLMHTTFFLIFSFLLITTNLIFSMSPAVTVTFLRQLSPNVLPQH